MFNTADLLLEELGLSSESSQNKSANNVPTERGVRQSQKKTPKQVHNVQSPLNYCLFLNFYIKNKDFVMRK